MFLFFHPTSSAHTYTRTHTQRFTRFRVLQRLVSKNLLFSFDFSTLDYLRFWTVLYTSSTSASLLLQNTSLLLVSSSPPPPPLTLQQHRHEGSATQGVIILDPIRESAERLERARARKQAMNLAFVDARVEDTHCEVIGTGALGSKLFGTKKTRAHEL